MANQFVKLKLDTLSSPSRYYHEFTFLKDQRKDNDRPMLLIMQIQKHGR
jgi:hypothetical protein